MCHMEQNSTEEEVSSALLQRSKGFQALSVQIACTAGASGSQLQENSRRCSPSSWGQREGSDMASADGPGLPSPTFRCLFAGKEVISTGLMQQGRSTATPGTMMHPSSSNFSHDTAADRCSREGIEQWLRRMEVKMNDKSKNRLRSDGKSAATAEQGAHLSHVPTNNALMDDLPPPAFVLLGLLSPTCSSAEHLR